jgi:hypothetical protein
VKGDAHLGEMVKHRSRVRRDPSQPNLRQVHLGVVLAAGDVCPGDPIRVELPPLPHQALVAV